MAKNIKISVDIFRQKWFRELTPDRKILWLFLLAESDLVGVFEIDAGVWNFICGPAQKYQADEPFWAFGNRVQRIPRHANKGIIVGKLDYQRNFSPNSKQWKWVEQALSDVGLTYEKLQRMREKEEEQLVLTGIVEKQVQGQRPHAAVEERKQIPPTMEMLKAYCEPRGVNAQNFYDFYESKGWRVGKERMRDWQAAVRTWEGRDSRQARKSDAVALDTSTQVVRKVY